MVIWFGDWLWTSFRTHVFLISTHTEISVIQMGPAKVEPPDECPKNFETALTNAGFGRFNVYVIVTCVVCCISSMGQTTSMSLIFPGAQCDLDLSLSDKGALNATTYVGMIISAIFWGFLADVKGRRQILVFGHLAIFVFDVICGLSQNFWMMIFAKFCGGLMWAQRMFCWPSTTFTITSIDPVDPLPLWWPMPRRSLPLGIDPEWFFSWAHHSAFLIY